jgi:hypothetical protein
MNEGDMPPHQFGKGLLGLVPGELFQQLGVRNVGHSPVICAWTEKGDKVFSVAGAWRRLGRAPQTELKQFRWRLSPESCHAARNNHDPRLRCLVALLFKFLCRAAKSGGWPPHSTTLARNPLALKPREASWSAPVLWRFQTAREDDPVSIVLPGRIILFGQQPAPKAFGAGSF